MRATSMVDAAVVMIENAHKKLEAWQHKHPDRQLVGEERWKVITEAAVEVLRLAGKPLHYKKITEIAIERNLLSHVGKTPEITMASGFR